MSSTLDMILSVKEQQQALQQLVEVLTAKIDQAQADANEAKERSLVNEKNIKLIAEQVTTMGQNAQESLQILYQQISGVEQSAIAMGKVLSALSQALIAKQLIADDDVLGGMRAAEDKDDRERLNAVVQAKLLTSSESVTDKSVLAVEQQHTDGKVLRTFRLIDMSNTSDKHPYRVLVGKKAGDTAAVEPETSSFKVLEVYEQVAVEPQAVAAP